jgi:hypothetical protein
VVLTPLMIVLLKALKASTTEFSLYGHCGESGLANRNFTVPGSQLRRCVKTGAAGGKCGFSAVSVFFTTTVASAVASPLGSVTVPVMAPVAVCTCEAGKAMKRTKAVRPTTKTHFHNLKHTPFTIFSFRDLILTPRISKIPRRW